MNSLEDLTPERIWFRIGRMNDLEARNFLEILPSEIRDAYDSYVLQKVRSLLNSVIEAQENYQED